MWSTLLAFIQVESRKSILGLMTLSYLYMHGLGEISICLFFSWNQKVPMWNNLTQILRLNLQKKVGKKEICKLKKNVFFFFNVNYHTKIVHVHMQWILTFVISIVYRKPHKLMTVVSAHLYLTFVFQCITIRTAPFPWRLPVDYSQRSRTFGKWNISRWSPFTS